MAKIDNEIHEIVHQFILDRFFNSMEEPAHLTGSIQLVDNGIVDSFGLHELLSFLEEKFGLSIEDREVTSGNLGSIDDITSFIMKRYQLRPKQ